METRDIKKIVKIELGHLSDRLEDKKYTIKFGPSVVDHICEIGYDKKFGARPLKRAIQSEIEDFISGEILKASLKESTKYTLGYVKSTEKFKLTEKAN